MIKNQIIKLIACSITVFMFLVPSTTAFSESSGVMIDLEVMMSSPDGDVEILPPLDPNMPKDERTIHNLYRKLLGRDPDPEGLTNWLIHLRKHGVASVEKAIKRSDEFAIGGMYRELLGRNPDRGGIEMWLAEIRKGNHNLDSVRESILNSREYQERTPSDSPSQPDEQIVEEPGSETGDQPGQIPVDSEETDQSEVIADEDGENDESEAISEEAQQVAQTQYEKMLAEIGIPDFTNNRDYDPAIRAGHEVLKKDWISPSVFSKFLSTKYIPSLQKNLKNAQKKYEKLVEKNKTDKFLGLGDDIESAGKKVQEARKKLESACSELSVALQQADSAANIFQSNRALYTVRLARLEQELKRLGDPDDSSTASERQRIIESMIPIREKIKDCEHRLSKHKILRAVFKQ
ncbi:MAG: hypothetical protein CVV41_17290 [Candidatus Riflebacteria bacterium HGW-Riflebacteria-1]|jgi:hypothetical protein|nr:MAG: hypothetical protein CVV41_17290 [Candidatus Riflebacteria bacterium HGW-Riflebacteria-1]